MKIILESKIEATSEDDGMALIADVASVDGFFVRLQSWDDAREHAAMNSLLGRQVRVTVETVDEANDPTFESQIENIISDALNSAIPEPWEVSRHATKRILNLISSGLLHKSNTNNQVKMLESELARIANRCIRPVSRAEIREMCAASIKMSQDFEK